jgi:hypothetical protein
MGRGRAKAKQQKVARELKYSSQGTDLDALARELAGSAGYTSSTPHVDDDDEDDDDTDDWVSATN